MTQPWLFLLQAGAGDLLPKPPSPSAFEPYGFAGLIFASFFSLVCFVILMGGRYFAKRDEVWAQVQEKRDGQMKDALDRRDTTLREAVTGLSVSHERAVDRVAAAAERIGEASAGVNREVALALRDLQKEVQQSHKVLSDETITGIIRRALRDVKGE